MCKLHLCFQGLFVHIDDGIYTKCLQNNQFYQLTHLEVQQI